MIDFPFLISKYAVKEKKTITVATLNYCDILNNPFEFYCQEHEKQLEIMSEAFISIIPQYVPTYSEKFKWNIGKIDQKIRIGRFSPAFELKVGVKDKGFMSKEQFEQKWETDFHKISEAKKVSFSESEKNEAKLYDFVLYHTLLSHAYGQKDFNKLIQNTPEKYLNTYSPFHQLSFLNEDKKLQRFLNSFRQLQADIFFIQESSDKLKQAIEKTNRYHVVTDAANDKMTIVKKASFIVKKPPNSVFSEAELEDLKWEEDPAIMVVDKYVIINIHFNSKVEKSQKQVELMKKTLLGLRKKYCWYHFIIGGDINSFMGTDGTFEKVFNFYPNIQSDLTSIKKRTMTQTQHHKGNVVVAESKDKIISDLKIVSGSIRYITNEEVKERGLIPSDKHPFDHFVVVASLQRP